MKWTMTATTAAIVVLGLTGCAKSATKAEFGDAVRHMTEQQLYDRNAAYNPDPAAVTGGDADRLNSVLESHRTISDTAGDVQAPVTGIRGRAQ